MCASVVSGCDGDGRPVRLLLTEGRVNDRRSAESLLPGPPDAKTLIAGAAYMAMPCLAGAPIWMR